MIIQIPYETVAYQVELLYSQKIVDEAEANKHCQFIAEFIRSCGWDEQDYFDRWMREQDKLYPILPERNINLS